MFLLGMFIHPLSSYTKQQISQPSMVNNTSTQDQVIVDNSAMKDVDTIKVSETE